MSKVMNSNTRLTKCQCYPHRETSQLICCANQLTSFYVTATLAFNGLMHYSVILVSLLILDAFSLSFWYFITNFKHAVTSLKIFFAELTCMILLLFFETGINVYQLVLASDPSKIIYVYKKNHTHSQKNANGGISKCNNLT